MFLCAGGDMNYDIVKSVYRVVGDELFEKICPTNQDHKKRKATKPEIMESVINYIKVNRKVLLSELLERMKFSRSSIQICLRALFDKGMVRKETDKRLSSYPVTYVWVGE